MSTMKKLGIKLEADTKSLSASMTSAAATSSKAAKAIDQAGDKAKETGKQFVSASIEIKQLSGGFGMLAKAAVAVGAVWAVKAAVQGVFEVTGRLNSELRSAHDTLGIGIADLSGLQTAAATAGVSFGSLTGGMETLGASVGAAVADPASDAGKALAELGLNAKELAGMSAQEQLEATADALARVAPSAEKTAAAEALLGSEAAALFPLLNQGSDALTKGAADAERFGTALTAVESAQITAATGSLNELWQTVQGVALTVGAEFAPYVQAATEAIVAFATESDLAGNIASTMSSILIEGARFAGDAWDAVSLVASQAANGFRVIGLVLLSGVRPPVEWLLWAFDKISGTNFAGNFKSNVEAMQQSLNEAGIKANEFQESLQNRPQTTGDAWAKSLEDIKNRAAEAATNTLKAAEGQSKLASSIDKTAAAADKLKQTKIDEAIGELQSKLDQFDATNADKAALALEKLGASQAEQDKAYDLQKQLDFMEAGRKATEELLSPAEKYGDRLAELDALLEEGAISQETYSRGALKAADELKSAMNVDPNRKVGMALAGSQAAASAVNSFRSQGAGKKEEWQTKLPALQEKSLKSSQEQTGLLRKLVEKGAGGGITLQLVTL